MTSRRTRIAALLAVPCLLGLAGCGSSASGSPDPSSSGSPGKAPSGVPAAAEAYSVAGAKAFAAAWVKELNHATVTGDTKTLLAMSGKQCAVCTDFAQHLAKIYSAGGHVDTKGWQVKSVIPIAGQSLKKPGFQVTVISAPQQVYPSKSAKPQSYRGGQQGMRMFLSRSHGQWMVQNIEIAQGG